MKKQIEVIEPVSKFKDTLTNQIIRKKRVAAYARVSTDEADQLNSYQTQIKEYTKQIRNNPEWEFAGLYSDEGISGTNMKKRAGFNKMIEAARNGNIDLILTKSISRFARNTVDCLTIIQEMRSIGVEIYFEKENLYSSDSKVDFLLTIMSSIAQEESRSISENIKWSIQKKFKEGKLIINTKHFLGYDKDDKGNLIINEEQAKTVKIIFNLFLDGYSPKKIAALLNKEGKFNGKGNNDWKPINIRRILSNEKYCGDALLQKFVTTDYLTHKSVKNKGVATQYYVTNNHEPIINKETFEIVQKLLIERTELFKNDKIEASKLVSSYPLTGLVYCGKCKRPMKRHHWNPNTKYQKVVLDCNHVPTKKFRCEAKVVDSELIYKAGCDIISSSLNKDISITDTLINILSKNLSSGNIKEDIMNKKEKVNELNKELKNLISLKIKKKELSDQTFNQIYSEKETEIVKLKDDIKSLELKQIKEHIITDRINDIKSYINSKTKNEEIFKSLIGLVIVEGKENARFIINLTDEKTSDLIEKFDEFLQMNGHISSTYFDEKLNANLHYKVIFYEAN